MKPSQFEYYAPETLDEVVSLLGQYGDEAKILAGGQSLIPLLALRLAAPSVVIDINRVSSLDYIHDNGDDVRVGALARHRAIEKHDDINRRCPMITDAIALVGHVAIRNRGTVVGSMAHADPASEWPAIALALDAEIDAVGPHGTRTIPAESFFLSFLTTVLEPDEIATEIRFKVPSGRVGSSFVELARRHGDFAVAGAGGLVDLGDDGSIRDARVVLIGVGGTALRIEDAESALKGGAPVRETFENASQAVVEGIDPTGDVHGSADFRRSIAGVLTRRALQAAAGRAEGGDRGR
jgi:carbon-monoxide dehydrogenase medium subunit